MIKSTKNNNAFTMAMVVLMTLLLLEVISVSSFTVTTPPLASSSRAILHPSRLVVVGSSSLPTTTITKQPIISHGSKSTTPTPTTLLMSDTTAGAESSNSNSSGGGTATIPELVFNLVKGIVGAGVLSLPAGIVAFGNAPSAVIPAVGLITLIGCLSGYGFALIGRCCSLTDTTSFRDAWSASIGSESSWIPAVSVTFKTLCAVLAYSMILGDTFASLLSSVGVTLSSQTTLLGVTGLILFPLCLLKNLSSLAPFSLLGSLGMVYTAIAMAIRYFGKAYAVGGKFCKDVPTALQPKFGNVGASGVLSPSAAILVAMLSTAYMVS